MNNEFSQVTCPSCFESFDVPAPDPNELPVELDYDCEICCRPMVISFQADEDDVIAEARSLDD